MEEILRPNGNSVTACKNSAGNQTDNFSYVDEAVANDAAYDIQPGESLEVTAKKGGNGDAEDLCAIAVAIIP